MNLTKEARIQELRSEIAENIMLQHVEIERIHGTAGAVEQAKANLAGSAEFLVLRLGRERAQSEIGQLLSPCSDPSVGKNDIANH